MKVYKVVNQHIKSTKKILIGKVTMGSNKTLMELVQTESLENFKREILILCTTKKTTYLL